MPKESPESYHQKLSLYFHGMIALPLAFFVYLFLEMRHNELNPVLQHSLWSKVVNFSFTLIAAAIVIFTYQQFKKGVFRAREQTDLLQKMTAYLDANVRAYLLAGLTFTILVTGLWLTTSAIFIVDYVLLLFLLSLHRPTPVKYVKDLSLSGKSKEIILNKGDFDDEN